MNLYVRTGVFAGMAGITLVCCLLFSNPTTNPESGLVVWLPKDVPGYSSERGEMGDLERKWLPQDTTYFKMTYKELGLSDEVAQYRALNATLIVAGSDARSLHRPDVCLRGQGWAIAGSEIIRLRTTGGTLDVKDYTLARIVRNEDGSPKLDASGNNHVQRAHYVYWWVGPSATTPSDEKKVWLAVWNSILKGENERWAYPAVMVLVDERYGEEGEKEARERALGFVRKYAPTFQKSLGAKDRADAQPLNTL